MRTCSDVHNYLVEAGVDHEIVQLPALSTTARRAAGLLGVRLHEIVKCLLFITDDGPLVCLVSGDAQVDVDRVRDEAHTGRCTLAPPADVLALTGYRPGAMPPCALDTALPVLADQAIFEQHVLYCGGGTTTTMLKIRSDDLRSLIEPRVAAIAARPAE